MSTQIPPLTPKEVVKVLKRVGFVKIRSKGSHVFLKNHQTGKMVIIPMHNRDLAPGTLRDIIEHSGLSDDEFLALL